MQRGDHQAALAIAGERVALATEANDSFELGWALNDRGLVLIRLGKAEQASEDIRRACELFESAGFVSATLSVKVNLAFLSVTAGDLEGGEAELEALLQQPGLQKIPRAWCAGNLACLKILSGEWEDARALLGAALPVVWEARDELFEFCLELLAAISVEDGDPRRSARLLGLARASLDERGVRVLDREAREVDLFERTYDRSRRLLGDEQFVAEQRKGRALLLNFRPDQVL